MPPAVGRDMPGGALNWEKALHVDAPMLPRRTRNATREVFMSVFSRYINLRYVFSRFDDELGAGSKLEAMTGQRGVVSDIQPAMDSRRLGG